MSPGQARLLVGATRVALRAGFRILGGFQVRGAKNIPSTGAAILAPNHLSWADAPAVRAAFRRDCWFMANHDLFERPILGKLIPLYGAFPVHRGTLDREALRRAQQHLRDGALLCMFPEGGTTLTGKLSPFEGGVAMLAMRNEVPVIPVAITGTNRVMADDLKLRYARGGVTVTFGQPITPESIDPTLPRRERMDLLTERMHAAVAAMLPAEYLP